jgi:hypothetical protein
MKTKLNLLFIALSCIAGLALPASVHVLRTYETLSEKNRLKTSLVRDTIPPVISCKPLSSINWNNADNLGLHVFDYMLPSDCLI